MQNLRKQLANELANDCKTVTDVRNAINGLFIEALEAILEAEITEHLGYEKHSGKGDNSGNSRNGSTTKTVQSRLVNRKFRYLGIEMVNLSQR